MSIVVRIALGHNPTLYQERDHLAQRVRIQPAGAETSPQAYAVSLRALRERAGLSQDELGLRTHISQSKLSRAERGYQELHEDERRRLAGALEVTLDALAAPTEMDPSRAQRASSGGYR